MARPIVRSTAVAHDWAADGWTPFTFRRLTADGTQQFAKTIAGARGRFAPVLGTNGNYRELALHQAMFWEDGEIEALIWGPSTLPVSGCQMGLVGRAKLDPNNEVRAMAGWYDVTLPFPQVINRNAVRGTAAGALEAATGANTDFDAQLRKTMRVTAALRIDGLDVSQYHCREVWDLRDGDVGDITGCATGSLNRVGVTAANVDPPLGFFQATDTTVGDVALSIQEGTFTLTNNVRAVFPYVLGLRVVGSTISTRVYRYRPGAVAPDWGDTAGVASTVPVATTFQLPTGPGFWGLWMGHGVTPNFGEFGWVRGRQL
jgi:hypothetical protein